MKTAASLVLNTIQEYYAIFSLKCYYVIYKQTFKIIYCPLVKMYSPQAALIHEEDLIKEPCTHAQASCVSSKLVTCRSIV